MRTKEEKDSVWFATKHLIAWVNGEDECPLVGESHLDIAYTRIDAVRREERLRQRSRGAISDHDPS